MVPKFLLDPETGEPGERNGVYVTGLEHKMGLKVSATCELTFGQHGTPAVGWLVGDIHNGIAQMFKVIEYARMMVGTKAIATLSTGYLNALDYAKTRVQGADMTQMTDKAAPRVTIIHHPDVRRALLTQKAYAEGLRALYLYTAAHQDVAVAEIVSGADAEMADRVNDLLLPIVKGVGSERAYQCLTESLQTFGGSGFLQDYPIEQYIRDAKIDSPLRGHHRDPGPGLLLPQDRPRPGQGAAARGRPDPGVPRQRHRAARTGRWPRAAGHRARRPAGDGRGHDRLPVERPGERPRTVSARAGVGARSCSRSATC